MEFGRSTMDCMEFRLDAGDVLTGEAVGEVRERLDRHAIECADCAAYLEDLRRIARALRESGPALAPPELWSRIEAGLQTPVRPAPVRRLLRFAAAACALIVFGFLLFSRGGPKDERLDRVKVTEISMPDAGESTEMVDPLSHLLISTARR